MNFFKQCFIGKFDHNTWISIRYTNGKLSISGVEGPTKNGNAKGSCGQILMNFDPSQVKSFAKGWDINMLVKLLDIWDTWNLNNMQAGSPNQNAYLAKIKTIKPPRGEHYTWAVNELKKVGLYEDEGYLQDGKPYAYGSAWLNTEVPQDVLDWLQSLPDADREHPWGKRV